MKIREKLHKSFEKSKHDWMENRQIRQKQDLALKRAREQAYFEGRLEGIKRAAKQKGIQRETHKGGFLRGVATTLAKNQPNANRAIMNLSGLGMSEPKRKKRSHKK